MLPFDGGIKQHIRSQAREMILGVLEGVGDVIVDCAYSIALIGGGLSILFHLAGWEKGKRWTGILVLGYTLVKYLLG